MYRHSSVIILDMFYLKDPTTKEPSPTLTLMVVGAGAVILKWVVAGTNLFGITIEPVSGVDCAALLVPLLGLYAHKRLVYKKGKIVVTEPKAPKKAPQ